MTDQLQPVITVQVSIEAPLEKVWHYFTDPTHIVNWNSASEDWHTPRAESDFKVGGSFLSRMEAKDGSMGFDLRGTFEEIELHKHIGYSLEDGRKVKIDFTPTSSGTNLIESFEAESQNSLELQQYGWQSILESFRRYVEN